MGNGKRGSLSNTFVLTPPRTSLLLVVLPLLDCFALCNRCCQFRALLARRLLPRTCQLAVTPRLHVQSPTCTQTQHNATHNTHTHTHTHIHIHTLIHTYTHSCTGRFSPQILALTSELLYYTYAHQVDAKSHKLSPYACNTKMDRGAWR